MEELLLVALAGFAATLVDGSLGMGFGPTSAALLLGTGQSPASTGAMVNVAKVVTGVIGAIAHWRLGNVDRRMARWLATAGVPGALLGSAALRFVDAETIRPVMAVLLVVVGARMAFRFLGLTSGAETTAIEPVAVPTRSLATAGAVGGTTNGLVGAWGPVVTSYLLHREVAPNRAVGSANVAEIAVAVTSIGVLAGSLGDHGTSGGTFVAMLAGGVVAAPLAAHVVRIVPVKPLGTLVAAMLVFTQLGELTEAGWLPGGWATAFAGTVAVLVLARFAGRFRRARREPQRGRQAAGSST